MGNQKKKMCPECPFHIKNWNKFKPDIYDHVKERARGLLHRCHIIGDNCNGYQQEAIEREDRDVMTLFDA